MYYKVVFNGQCQGQDIKNILYYREGLGVPVLGDALGWSRPLAEEALAEIWPAMQLLMPNDYTLQTIDVYPHNDLFQLVAQVPYSLPVNENGSQSGLHAGISMVMNFRFQLQPTTIVNGILPPRFGYVAMGPVPAAWVGENGQFVLGPAEAPIAEGLALALQSNLETIDPIPATFWPIRVRHNRVLGGLVKWQSWADVSYCSYASRASWRRSRMPE